MNNYIQLAKQSIQQLAPYEPGKPVADVAKEFGLNPSNIIKMASNENPLGYSDKVKTVLSKEYETLSYYPDGNAFEARTVLADYLNTEPEKVLLGNGSDEVLRLIALAYAGEGDEVIFSQYGFAVYPIATLAVGATPVEVPAKNWGHDLSAMLKAINNKTKIIYIANPNNPTGTYLPNNDIAAFMQQVPSTVIVVLDEAYVEYQDNIDIRDTPSWVSIYKNLIITRTFSKAYGLAGLRVGYAVASPQVADIINRIRPSFNVSSLAQKTVSAALQDQQFIAHSRDLNNQGMQQMKKGLHQLNLNYIPSAGNFVAVDIKCSGVDIFKRLMGEGIIVRPLSGYGMKTYLRVSIGLEHENDAFLEAIGAVLKQHKA